MRSEAARFQSATLPSRSSVARALAPAFAWGCLGVALSVAPSHAQFFNAVYSRDALDVVAVADSGSLYRSVSGGVAWSRTQLGDKALLDVAARGRNIVVVGERGKVGGSAELGERWEVGGGTRGRHVQLRGEGQAGGKGVWVEAADRVYIRGGGGFIRRSVDGGNSWSFQQHGLQGQISDLYFVGRKGWAASSRLRAV